MATVWNDEHVQISDTMAVKMVEANPVLVGVGIMDTIPFTFEAYVTPQGWYVTINGWGTGRRGEFQGATFNLMLEVATAARRLV